MTSRAEGLRKERRTPGTYAYAETHGLGKAGEKKRARQRRWLGTAKGFLVATRKRAKERIGIDGS